MIYLNREDFLKENEKMQLSGIIYNTEEVLNWEPAEFMQNYKKWMKFNEEELVSDCYGHATVSCCTGVREMLWNLRFLYANEKGKHRMDDSEFNRLADTALKQIETALENSGADLDFSMVSSGVLEIELDDGSKIIVNRHSAAQEVWVAARSGGFHFRWDGQAWRDTRDSSELMSALSALITRQSGETISLA